MIGGGTIFGPTPHGYDQKVNKKVKALARRSAFSAKAQEGKILVVEDFMLEEIKTKPFAAILKNLGLDEKKTLMLTPEYNLIISRSGKNIQKVNIMSAEKASTYDILNSHTVLFQKTALKKLEETLG
jgi:large subunit ribosomal protein L4